MKIPEKITINEKDYFHKRKYKGYNDECAECKKAIINADACGFGAKFMLDDGCCSDCGGESWCFCSLKCLKAFVKNKRSR